MEKDPTAKGMEDWTMKLICHRKENKYSIDTHPIPTN